MKKVVNVIKLLPSYMIRNCNFHFMSVIFHKFDLWLKIGIFNKFIIAAAMICLKCTCFAA